MKSWLVCLGLCSLLLAGFFSRIWTTSPNLSYIKQLFEHSQWRLPLSTRIMSDEKLYQYAGVYIVETGDLFSVNPEVPPLAKYIYGWSQQVAGNAYLVTPLYLSITLSCLYLLSRKAGNTAHQSRWLVIIALLTPLLFSQLSQTMLDLPQLTFLLLHLVLLLQITTKSQKLAATWLSLLAGAALGAMAATKVPVMAPIISALAVLYLWKQQRFWLFLPLSLSASAIYIASFSAFFMHGHSWLEWLRTQKWMIEFYRQGQVDANHLMLPISVLTGWYRGWWDQPWQRIVEWSSLWPASLIAPWWFGWQALKKKIQITWNQLYLCLVFLGLLFLNVLLPFWPRYYLLLFPFGLIFLPQLWQSLPQTLKKPLGFVGVAILFLETLFFLRPVPSHTLELASSSWQKGHYQDLYEFLSPESQANTSRETFYRSLKKIELASSQPAIEIAPTFSWPWQQTSAAQMSITYQTPIGPYTQSVPLQLRRLGTKWVIDWDWDNALPQYSPESVIAFIPWYPYYGRLSTFDRTVLSLDGLVPQLHVVPDEISPAEALPILAEATELGSNLVEAAIFVDAVGNWHKPLVVSPTVDQKILTQLSQTPGIYLIPTPGRVISPIIYNYNVYEWEKHLEFTHPELNGQLGGQFLLQNPQQDPIILLTRPVVNGQDVVINDTAQALFYEPVTGQPE